MLGPLDQPRPDDSRHLNEHQACPVGRNLIPHRRAIVGRQRLEHERHVGGVHRPQALVQFDQVLTMLEAFEQVALGALLPMGERFEDAVTVEQPRDLVETLLQAGLGL